MITLNWQNFKLDIAPERGGGITRFHWNGIPIFTDARNGNSPLDLSCFPLVPFSNRIAHGTFSIAGQQIVLPPNYPSASIKHAIHGYGWLNKWDIIEKSENTATLRYHHQDGVWPWEFVAEQIFTLSDSALHHSIGLTNLSAAAMPAGLGLHPYFPRKHASLSADFDGLWHVSDDGLPQTWKAIAKAPDIAGGPTIDNAFTGRKGNITIAWLTHMLRISPANDLSETVIYVPKDEGYFCIEPVSHIPDAINHAGMRMLAYGEKWETGAAYSLEPVQQMD